MGSFFYEYEVEWYCEDNEEMRTSRGVTFSGSLADAITNITTYYGSQTIDRLEIFTLLDECCYDFNDDCYEHNFTIKSVSKKGN